MMKSLIVLLLLIFYLKGAQSINCHASHFDFIGVYSLGKQDELNRTFTKIQEKVNVLQNSTFQTPSATFTIFDAKPLFFSSNTNQTAQIIGNDTVVIWKGILYVNLTFNWVKRSATVEFGNGFAIGKSDSIAFAYSILVKDGRFYGYQFLDADDVSFYNGFQLITVNPQTTAQFDKEIIFKMLNRILGVNTVTNLLEEQIKKYFVYYLRNSLQDEDMPIYEVFDYHWINKSQAVTIPFNRKAAQINIERSGLYYSFDTQVANDKQWRCGDRSLPRIPLYPKTYGSAQEFVSYDFYQNTLRYAVQKKLLDSELNRENWGSKSFEFQAKGLYSVFEGIEDDFGPSERVGGECVAKEDGVRVGDNGERGESTFNASMLYDCTVSINDSEVAAFSVALTLQVEGVPKTRSLDFELRSYSSVIAFRPTEYALLREDSARAMVEECLERLFEARLFGSGWATSPPRYYPIFRTEKNYTVLYDPSQVNKAGLQIGEIQ